MCALLSRVRRKPRPARIVKRRIGNDETGAFIAHARAAPARLRKKIGFKDMASARELILQEIRAGQFSHEGVILQKAYAGAGPRHRQGQTGGANAGASVDGKAGKIARSRRREKHGVGAATVAFGRLTKEEPAAKKRIGDDRGRAIANCFSHRAIPRRALPRPTPSARAPRHRPRPSTGAAKRTKNLRARSYGGRRRKPRGRFPRELLQPANSTQGRWCAEARSIRLQQNRDGAPRATASHRITISGFLSVPRGACL